ncbi:hypothetical protein U1Q18_003438 [Sarracenia purpurea var. burkii]
MATQVLMWTQNCHCIGFSMNVELGTEECDLGPPKKFILIALGQLVPDPEAFPSGIKALADYDVHGKGLKLGIYSDAG